MSAIAPISDKIGKLIRMLSSDKDGEVMGAVHALRRTLSSAGTDLHALADAIGGGKKFSEADAAEIYLRGLEEGRRQAARNGGFHSVGEPTWHEIALECQKRNDVLRGPAEREFVSDMVRRTVHGGRLTEKQEKWLRDIYARVGRP
jgi:hypothetical protein